MRVTIAKSGVFSTYGIAMPVGTIQTVDNAYGASLVYAGQATDTDGVLLAPTNKPFDITIETPIYPITPTAAGIQAAISAVAAAGGGIVQLPSGRIVLSTTLQMFSGVKLKGVAPQLVYNTIPDSGLTTLVGSAGGTVLVPNGAFDAIAWNTGALAAPASQTAFSQGALTNISIEDLGFSGDLGGTWGIHAGNTNNPSAWYSQFINLYATGFIGAGGGFNITNYQHCQFSGNYTFGCAWGQLHQIDVASASLAPGNSTYYDLYNCNPTGLGVIPAILARNISFITTATTGGSANNNEFKFDRIQSNRFGGTTTTQAATMVNTQANITITDGTRFAVGLPVTVDATQNGFTLKKVYFVISVAGNVIQLSNTYGGAAVTATAAVAVNIVHQGFPCFEMIGLAGSSNTNVIIDNLDVEGLSTAAVFFQNCNGGIINISQVPGTAQATQSIVCRGCANMSFHCPQSVSTDWDNNAVGSAMGFFGARYGTSIGYMGYGVSYDSVSGKLSLSLGGQFDSPAAAGLTLDPATAGGFLAPRVAGIGEMVKTVNGTVSITNLNLQYTNFGAAAVMTLPSVVAANQGAWLKFFNPTAGAQTINTDGVQLFNGVAGRTGLTLNANASVYLCAMVASGTPTYTWVVMGGSSAMAAGVISAPT